MLKRTVSICCLVFCVAIGAAGQEAGDVWQPAVPNGLPDTFDWIRLPSHEWLKGELISMYDDKLEFDSDELGVLRIDWDDVREIRSSRVVQVGREGAEPLVGRLLMKEDRVTVFGGEPFEFDRSQILTLIVGEPREINLWAFKVTIGGNFRSGNTDQVEYSAKASAARRSVHNRVVFDYNGNMSSLDSVESANNARVNAKWDHFVNRRLFVNLAGLEWYRDPFKNLSSQTGVTAGIGYEFVDTSRVTWSGSIGPAYQLTTFSSVEEGEDESVETPALTLSTGLDVDVTDDIEIEVDYRATFTNSEAGKYIHHFEVGLDFELTSRMDFNVSWVWDRTEKPTADAEGVIPEADDLRLSLGLGWEF
jgi:opacity protein-like surface antigen